MKIICISEHFHPKVGGTVTYVHQSCKALAALGHEVSLIYPGSGEPQSIQPASFENFHTLAIGIGVNIKTAFPRSLRYQFCQWAADYVDQQIAQGKVEVVHVLYGMFLTEALPTEKWKQQGIGVFTTIHNVPPAECGLSWPGDSFVSYHKDRLRKRGVKYKNHQRLKAHAFDAYITPSSTVSQLLKEVLPTQPIHAIGHGTAAPEQRPSFTPPVAGQAIQILTAGGFVPHKNQHTALRVARLLREKGFAFSWHMIGPVRHERYYQFLQQQIRQQALTEQVILEGEVPYARLQELYRESDLYVQPSLEEGFCMTTLDAAKYGLPIIGTPAGAIPEIIEMSSGILTEHHPESIAAAILQWAQIAQHYSSTPEKHAAVLAHFTWENAARQLEEVYHAHLG